MGRPATKKDLMQAARTEFINLNDFIASMTETELTTPFQFDEKKKEAHWKRDKNLRDVLIHLYEWHQLLLQWVAANQNGEDRPFLPQPYNWRSYGTMNIMLWEKHQKTSLDNAVRQLEQSHQEVIRLAETFSNEELFSKGAFPWVGTNCLGSYFVSTTSSHYQWAIKKLKAHRRNCK